MTKIETINELRKKMKSDQFQEMMNRNWNKELMDNLLEFYKAMDRLKVELDKFPPMIEAFF